MENLQKMNIVISDSARGRMNDGLYSKIMNKVKKGVNSKTMFGFKVSKIGSSIILF